MITRYAVAKTKPTATLFGTTRQMWLLIASDDGETWEPVDDTEEPFMRRICRLLNAEEADLAVAEFKNSLGDEPA